MIHKMRSPRPGYIRVVFELPACLWADRIFLVGDFNGWSKDTTPFIQGRDGIWRASVDLLAGHSYQFRYMVDGTWQTDYHADGWIDNEYGSQNSVIDASLDEEELVPIPQAGRLREELQEATWAKRKAVRSPAVQPARATTYATAREIRAVG